MSNLSCFSAICRKGYNCCDSLFDSFKTRSFQNESQALLPLGDILFCFKSTPCLEGRENEHCRVAPHDGLYTLM